MNIIQSFIQSHVRICWCDHCERLLWLVWTLYNHLYNHVYVYVDVTTASVCHGWVCTFFTHAFNSHKMFCTICWDCRTTHTLLAQYTHAYIYIYITHVHVFIHKYIHSMCFYKHTYVCVCVCLHSRIICMYICIYVFMCTLKQHTKMKPCIA